MDIKSCQGREAEKAGKLYNLRIIENFCRGNQDVIIEMIKTFIIQIPKAIEDIRLANAAFDYAEIKSITHRIKPILSYYAVSTMEVDLGELEGLAQTGISEKASIELKIEKLTVTVMEVIAQMKEIV